MAITGTLGRTLGAGAVACLVLLGPATGVVGAQVSAVARAPSMAAPAADRSVPTPGIASFLLGAACASSRNCWAVGGFYPTRQRGLNQALRWNGRRWSLVPTPTPGAGSTLIGAACASSGNCWAVGSYLTSQGGGLNQALHWNGRRWSLVSTPHPGTSASFSGLASIRCTSAIDCWAVGNYEPNSSSGPGFNLVLHWNGRRWSLVPTPQPGGTASTASSELEGIRCTSSGSCWAVGSYSAPGSQNTDLNQVLHWNGRRWSLVPTPQPGGTASGDFSMLSHVSCASPSGCWAVGAYGTRTGNQRTELNQALHWNGRRWSLASLPEPDGIGTGAINHLNDVFCTSPADCWAVGRFGSNRTGGVSLNQALHWNGRLWSLVPTPDPGGTAIGDSNELYSIRCTSSANCWAVGNVLPNGQNGRNQVLHWNGIRWSTG